MLSSSQALLLGAFLQSVTAMDLAHAAQRNHARDVPIATTTPAPLAFIDELNLFAGHNGLQVRQEATTSSSLVVTIAPSNTCGYMSGMPGVAITCENRSSCSWATVSTLGTTSGLVGCGAEIYITCVESSKAVDPGACDDLCQSNTFFLHCTNSDEPFCRTYAYPKGIRDYRCASTEVESVQSVKFTYEGEENPSFRTTTIGGTSSQALPTITDADTTTFREPIETDTHTTTSDAPAPTHKSKSTPVGAIVGGVVGGVALIGLIGLGVFVLLRRCQSTPAANPTPAQPVMAQQQPPAPLMNQNQYPQQQPYPPVVSSYPDPSMAASPAPSDPHLSMMSGPVSSVGAGSPTAWNQHPSPPTFHTPAPTYEMPGLEAREQEPVYEIGTDSRKT
ncbi:hypothetical protein RAB80_002262 [Fusarium oxysporum f. sp. vasinfectum]|nr:hypothetical protein RAB80_010144 [Fusarium oxysporum f. sp. vasinfectum]KAK2680469.1 hypothetical protein RAB80_002262 [Fusarium oxysporum f. sp. vasinfectum]KAK2931601.1 hypothetical protein FoTM2_009113 [Fusarium oxysporum f. sp. vasinfectum]